MKKLTCNGDFSALGAIGLVTFAALLPVPARAQAPSPAEILEALKSGGVDQFGNERANSARVQAYNVFESHRQLYSDAARMELLDGLQELAIFGSADPKSLASVFTVLKLIATDTISGPEDQEIPERLIRIYRESTWLDTKGLALRALGEVPGDGEVVTFLESVATSPPPEGVVLAPKWAIEALAARGSAVPVLRRLHEQGAVTDPNAAFYLSHLAKNGFRLPSKN